MNTFSAPNARLRQERPRAILAIAATATFTLFLASTQPLAAEDDPVTYEGAFPAASADAAKVSARAEAAEGDLYNINAVVLTGDRHIVMELPNWDSYENDALYEPMSEADVEAFRQRIMKDLQDQGYLFSTVRVYRPSLGQGFLKLRVHVGEKGEVTVSGNKWYRAEQILDSVEWETGGNFNYRNLYDDLFAMNVRPGMEIETELKPRVDADGKRVVDIDFVVEDRFPLHVAWNISNTGSKETGDWRSRLTAQWLNPTLSDDSLTFEWTTDPANFSDINSYTLGYNRPLNRAWNWSIYAGHSESDIYDVLPQLDVFGQGEFIGTNFATKIVDTKTYSLDLSFGWLYQESVNTNKLEESVRFGRRTKLSMPRVTFGYAAKDYDGANGRNFFSTTLMANFGGRFGSSLQDEFSQQNANPAKKDVLVMRTQIARFQKLAAEDNKLFGKWSMFMRMDSQITSNSVPSPLYKSIGGADSVRGFRERTEVGDYGFNSTVEIRTGLFENFLPGMVRDEEYLRENPDDWLMHRLQFALFWDLGWVALHEPLAGSPDDTTLSSVGAGLRFGFTKYSQFRLDYGFPIVDSTDVGEDAGHAHFSLQLQY